MGIDRKRSDCIPVYLIGCDFWSVSQLSCRRTVGQYQSLPYAQSAREELMCTPGELWKAFETGRGPLFRSAAGAGAED